MKKVAYIVRRDLILVPHIDRRQQHQSCAHRASLHHRIQCVEDLHSALIPNRLLPFLPTLPARPSSKVHDIRLDIQNQLRESLHRVIVFQRKYARLSTGIEDGVFLGWVADNGGDGG